MRKRVKKLLAVLASAAMAVSLAACSAKTETAETKAQAEASSAGEANDSAAQTASGGEFIIGCPQPLTGTNAQPGECALNAVKLAAKQFNEQGGINGQTVKVLSYDDQGLPEEAVKLATRMLQADGCQAIIGSCISSCVLSSGKIYNDAKIPTFGTGTSPQNVGRGRRPVSFLLGGHGNFRGGLRQGEEGSRSAGLGMERREEIKNCQAA